MKQDPFLFFFFSLRCHLDLSVVLSATVVACDNTSHLFSIQHLLHGLLDLFGRTAVFAALASVTPGSKLWMKV